MGLFDNCIAKASLELVEPIANLKANTSYLVTLYKDKLLVRDILSKKSVELTISKIKNVFYGTETEVIEKNKSVLGRAIVGTILPFGALGTVVGAVSGVGTKQKKKKHTYLIIEYTSSSEEVAYIKFEDKDFDGRRLAKELEKIVSKDIIQSNHVVL